MNVRLLSVGEAIDSVLPQIQCGKCGYDGCRPYAEAIATGTADINQCPPGGEQGVRDIAAVLGVPVKALDTRFGAPCPDAVAIIEEEKCIGCTLCIQACPVDAIVGAAKLMHTVIAAVCTGCERCIAPCPVDCIRMDPTSAGDAAMRRADAKRRFDTRNLRLERARTAEAQRSALELAARSKKKKQETIARALERAKLRLKAAGRKL